MLSDDLVNDMYLKLHDCKKEINDFYVVMVIRNSFLTHIKSKKTISIEGFDHIQPTNDFELNDYEKYLIDSCAKLPYIQLELLKENYELSIRDIEKKYPFIKYQFINKELTRARQNLLGVDIDLYKNKRLRYLNKK